MLTVELATLRTRGAYWYNCEWNVEESNIKAAMENLSAKRDSSGIDGMKLSDLPEWRKANWASDIIQTWHHYRKIFMQWIWYVRSVQADCRCIKGTFWWGRLCGGSRVLQQINRTASVSEIEKHWLFL